MDRTDIFISGGGLAGLTAAAAFGSAGFSVVIADPAPQVVDLADPNADLRTTAFLQPARELLKRAGVWDALVPHAAPLNIMRIVDAGGNDNSPPVIRDFEAQDISDVPFGWNFPNAQLRAAMLARLSELPNVTLLDGVGFRALLTRNTEALVTLSDDKRIRAKLVIGADGRHSAVREALGIPAKVTRYGQRALVFAVTHDAPHNNVSTEVHRVGGPFTLVPLPDRAGKPCSAVVWMNIAAEVERLKLLPVDDFNAAATERSAHVQGNLRLISARASWPIISQIAARLTGERTALIAEAAHVVPPIGAQGLNMSLADIATLLDLALNTSSELGAANMLNRYHTRRHPEMVLRVNGVDALNRTSMSGSPILHAARAKGVAALHDIGPVRKSMMHLGLGAGRMKSSVDNSTQ